MASSFSYPTPESKSSLYNPISSRHPWLSSATSKLTGFLNIASTSLLKTCLYHRTSNAFTTEFSLYYIRHVTGYIAVSFDDACLISFWHKLYALHNPSTSHKSALRLTNRAFFPLCMSLPLRCIRQLFKSQATLYNEQSVFLLKDLNTHEIQGT